LAKGKNIIDSPLKVGDTQVILKAAEQLGATVNKTKEHWTVWAPDELRPLQGFLDLKNSGTGLALLAAVTTLSHEPVVLNGDGQLRSRQMSSFIKALRRLGADINSTKLNETPPLLVMSGGLKGGKAILCGAETRYLPALSVIAPYAEKAVELVLGETGKIFAEPAVEVLSSARVNPVMTKRGITFPCHPYRPFRYSVRKEVVGAASAIMAGCISGEVSFSVDKVSARDEVFIKSLEAFGVKSERKGKNWRLWAGKLQGAELDLSWAPELVPLMAVLASMAKGRSVIVNAGEARAMKSDRISAISQEMKKMGGKVLEEIDGLIVEGPGRLKGCEVDGHGDYMVVAALAVAAMFADGKTVVKGAEATGTSCFRFTSSLREIGAEVVYA
jgi:3-phosphoshikimate 1-carboxyvinyltransferase